MSRMKKEVRKQGNREVRNGEFLSTRIDSRAYDI